MHYVKGIFEPLGFRPKDGDTLEIYYPKGQKSKFYIFEDKENNPRNYGWKHLKTKQVKTTNEIWAEAF